MSLLVRSPYPWVASFLVAMWALSSWASSDWPAVVAALVALKSGALAVLAATDKGKRLWAATSEAGACGVLAVVFVFHGAPKVLAMGEGGMLPRPMWLMVGLVETLGGLLMIVGPKVLRMLAALGLMAVMATAILTVHAPQGFDFSAPGNGGFEYQLVLLLLAHNLYVRSGGWSPVHEAFRRLAVLDEDDEEAGSLAGELI